MGTKRNVAAAISAAVYLYLEAEQQIAAPTPERKAVEPPRAAFSSWSLAGRQSMMEMRRLLQMRLVR